MKYVQITAGNESDDIAVVWGKLGASQSTHGQTLYIHVIKCSIPLKFWYQYVSMPLSHDHNEKILGLPEAI